MERSTLSVLYALCTYYVDYDYDNGRNQNDWYQHSWPVRRSSCAVMSVFSLLKVGSLAPNRPTARLLILPPCSGSLTGYLDTSLRGLTCQPSDGTPHSTGKVEYIIPIARGLAGRHVYVELGPLVGGARPLW